MNTLQVNYKYKVGQVIYFMYENEIRKGIVTSITITLKSKELARYLTKEIINKIISIFDKDYPFDNIWMQYSIDLVSKNGGFEAGVGSRHEYEIYESQQDLIQALSLK